MSPVILFIFLACSCASLVYGVENDTKISVCDTNAYYACGCDEVFKVTTDEFVVNVRCSLISLTAINPDMLLPKFIDVLDLSGNDIEEVAYNGVLVSSTMSILYLNRNKINKIVPGSFQDLPSLRKLDLSENYIESIEQNVFQGIYKLEYLYLNSNKLKSLPTNVFQSLPRLDILVLNHNNLGESLANITDIFSKEGLSLNPNLRYLYLKYINLTNLHDHYFDSAYNLRDLQLSGNPITSFSQLPYTLEVLDISDTNISSLGPRDFVNLPALKELYLNDLSNLTEISNHTFHPLKGLIKIELKNCKNLKYFSPFAFGVNAAVEGNDEYAFPVLTLDLMGSGLRTLDERLMPLFSRLTVLDIRMNPWNCDCKLKWLLQLNIKESDKAAISCNKPPNFQGRQLWSLEPADLDCKSWSVTISGLTRVTLVFLCVALAALALWLVTLWAPSYVPRPPHAPGPDSPYSRITITPNTAQDL